MDMNETTTTTAALAQAKNDAACIEAHDMGRHAQSGQFIAFCPCCQAEAEAINNSLRSKATNTAAVALAKAKNAAALIEGHNTGWGHGIDRLTGTEIGLTCPQCVAEKEAIANGFRITG